MVDFAHYITQYGQEVGLPNLKLNKQNICSLNFDSKISIDIIYRPDQDQYILASPIGNIPSENREEFFKQLLISNVFGIENGGAILGIEDDENRVVLSYMFIASTFSFELFKTVLGNFVNIVEEWLEKYETLCSSVITEYDSDRNESLPQNFQFTRI